MAATLGNLYSIINDKLDAKDVQRVFTFIEFIKEFGYDNTTSSFLNDYKTYLSLWSQKQNNKLGIDDKEWIRNSLIDTLKSIVFTYSSYEEQDFIANIDWDNEMHRRAIIPFFAEKLKNLCDFYKNKRQDGVVIVNKNKFKGSRTSIEQIIYDKIIDFYFENRDLSIQVSEIKEKLQQNLSISIEQYIDIYSDYFDIPRDANYSDDSRLKFISANINTPNYEDYLEVAKIVSDTLFSGEIYLEEIPLIAQVGLDLSQQCAGDVATIRDTLLNNATINLISINDQILLRRRLYEKYLGCDLYYIYCDTKDSISFDILTTAENPSGNLLNCGNSDTAVIESDELKLLSKIGLFFKPDKTGILKVNADNFKWEIDKSKLSEETFYIFPDPNKYGDIGNNKSKDYPLIFEYKLDSYVKNLSSGYAKDEPLGYIAAATWNTYYSIQDRDYILNDNQDFNYSFTSLANSGILSNYQKDLYNNEFGLLKGYRKEINEDGETVLYVPTNFAPPEITYKTGGIDEQTRHDVLFNGGYYQDPRTETAAKFPDNEYLRLADDYIWTGFDIRCNEFTVPDITAKLHLDMGSFSPSSKVKYKDHYKVSLTATGSSKTVQTSSILSDNFKSKLSELTGFKIVKEDKTAKDLSNSLGTLYLKSVGGKPFKFMVSHEDYEIYSNENFDEKIKNYTVFENLLLVETENKIFVFEEEVSESPKFYEIESIEISDNEAYSILYNESSEQIIIAILRQNKISENLYSGAELIIHELDIATKKLSREIINKNSLSEENLSNFDYYRNHNKISDISFRYNNDLDIYILAYMAKNSSTPYLYQHQFRLYNKDKFNATLKSELIYNMDSDPEFAYYPSLEDSETDFFEKMS